MIAIFVAAYALVGVLYVIPQCVDHLRRFREPYDWFLAGALIVLSAMCWPVLVWKARK